MKIEDQVCSKEQGEKLYNLGISKTGHIVSWVFDTLNCRWAISKLCVEALELCNNKNVYPAFTVAELGIMLGRGITVHQPTPGRNEAIDRANDLIHLLEIGELLIDGCNERLTH